MSCADMVHNFAAGARTCDCGRATIVDETASSGYAVKFPRPDGAGTDWGTVTYYSLWTDPKPPSRWHRIADRILFWRRHDHTGLIGYGHLKMEETDAD